MAVGRAESTIMTGGLVGLGILWWWNNYGEFKLPSGVAPASSDQLDFWTTPLYLRSNQPMAQSTMYVLPINPLDSYSLAAPITADDTLGGSA